MSDMRVRIDPATLMIDGVEGRTFTADEFAALVPPDCPVCGTQVRIDQINVTFSAEEEAAHGRSYIAGMWDCPHGCNPRTGERMHFGQSFESRRGVPGVTCTCTCGDTTVVLSEAEGQAWRAEPREVTGE